MNLRRVLSFACLSLASLSAAPAMAGPLGYFEFSNLRSTVTDLAPDDGVAAAISFEPATHYSGIVRGSGSDRKMAKSYWGYVPGAVSVSAPEGMAGGRSDGSVYRAEVAPDSGAWQSWYDVFEDFTLTPYSRVTFSYDWTMLSVLPLRATDPAVAVRNWGNLSVLFADHHLSFVGVPSYEMNGPSSGTLSLTIESGANGERGMFNASADSFGYDFAPPSGSVPEPATCGLMMAGLVGIAALRRRRQQ